MDVVEGKLTLPQALSSESTQEERNKQDMRQRFGLTLVFMATRSGLTRWQDIAAANEQDDPKPVHFSEKFNKAIDEIWYKRAVEYYGIDPNAFVYSVPFKSGDNNDTLVTASHAIFHTEGARSAPAAVVGFQFHQSALHARFINITSTCDNKPTCEATCATDSLSCYILDNNGYIVVSENREHTGKFFGEVNGGVMQMLVDDKIFTPIVIYDYQAVCFEPVGENNKSCRLLSPISYISWMINWFFGRLIWMIGQTQFNWILSYSYAYGSMEDESYESEQTPNNQMGEEPGLQGDKFRSRVMINKTQPQPCDTRITLYQLAQDIKKVNVYPHQNHCTRPYTLTQVHYSNMVLVVVNSECKIPVMTLSTDPVEVSYNNSSLACFKLQVGGSLGRRRLRPCICKHVDEPEIDDCGSGTRLKFSAFLSVLMAIKHAAHILSLLNS